MHLVSGEDQLALLAVPLPPHLRTLGSAETQLTGYLKDTSLNPYLGHPRGDVRYCLKYNFLPMGSRSQREQHILGSPPGVKLGQPKLTTRSTGIHSPLKNNLDAQLV